MTLTQWAMGQGQYRGYERAIKTGLEAHSAQGKPGRKAAAITGARLSLAKNRI